MASITLPYEIRGKKGKKPKPWKQKINREEVYNIIMTQGEEAPKIEELALKYSVSVAGIYAYLRALHDNGVALPKKYGIGSRSPEMIAKRKEERLRLKKEQAEKRFQEWEAKSQRVLPPADPASATIPLPIKESLKISEAETLSAVAQEQYFETQSLYLATALWTIGYPIFNIRPVSDKLSVIVFLETPSLLQLVEKYNHYELAVDALSFTQKLGALRTKLLNNA